MISDHVWVKKMQSAQSNSFTEIRYPQNLGKMKPEIQSTLMHSTLKAGQNEIIRIEIIYQIW